MFGFTSFVSGAEYSLFTGNSTTTLQASPVNSSVPRDLPPAKQWRPTALNPAIVNPNVLAKGDVLTFNLFNGTVYSAHIDKISTNINRTVTVRGRIDGFPFGYMIISTSGGRSLGSIEIPEKGEYYIIQSEPNNGTHYLLNVDPNQLGKIEDAPAVIPPTTATQENARMDMLANTLSANPLDQVTIDVMIVYTAPARDWANSSGGGIANVIAQAVAKGQLALDNSNAYVTLNLVYSGEVSYTESGDSETDVVRLRMTSDGYLDEVHTLRNQYYADIVGLFTYTGTEGLAGIGYQLTSTSGNPAYAFSLTRVQYAGWTFTYIHEMGHNMGCGHHKEQNVQPGPGVFNYSAGWRWIGNDSGKYCSIMTYEAGKYFEDGQTHTRVAYFSNPGVLYKNVATGNSTDGDNARTIRETKAVIAGYRTGTSTPAYIDIGLRLYDGTQIIKIACEQGTPTSPLRISKSGTTYGIVLVDPSDSYASGIIIQTSSGRKAVRKFQ
jgi:hypothetical protein